MSVLTKSNVPASEADRRSGPIRVRVVSTELPSSNPLLVHEALVRDRALDDVYLLESLDGPTRDRNSATIGWGRLAELRVFADRVELSAPDGLGEALGARVSMVCGYPSARRGAVRLWRVGGQGEVWRLLAAFQAAFEVDTDVSESAFAFGFLTALSYEAAWEIEKLPPGRAESELPRCTLTLFRHTLWYDLRTGVVRHLGAYAAEFPPGDERIPAVVASPAPTGPQEPEPLPAARRPRSVRDTVDEATFADRVRRCLDHIGVGDSYQIQIGHRIEVETDLTPTQVYRRLRYRSPSPYMYLAPWAGRTVIGASPELFVRVEGGRIVMRPIAGTVARATDPAEDGRRVTELRTSAKEQAEHVMLVDLCRNDIGRVCKPRSLSVDTMMDVEPFAYVHHLVSTVSGELNPGTDVWDVIQATFPAGTMTGAPKIRAMEIINEMEGDSRGIYAGALGLVDVRGFAVLALCIRTAVHDGRRYTTQASAGVVADSQPAAEWRETLAKMSAPYWALTGEELLP
ncbi:anthranilate synthase component I family protein [Streptomyces orinoci]|uniref:Anthranilate synthase component I family protein n=1 Tax=Streptomyces orinoci TaxID=67339 RepID=A0ABV3JRA4_STRON|nr:anthranilate synthase component I family protein [Streptomyces orinoci]